MRLASVALIPLIGLSTSVPLGSSPAPSPPTPVSARLAHARQATRTFVVADSGNEVRYRVREQLAGIDFPNDAVGKTTAVSGGIAIGADGKPVPDGSKFIVKLDSLTSDRDRRDGYLRRRTLETEQYPTVELTPTALKGVTLPIPATGSRTMELLGDLTIRGVTRPTSWKVSARFEAGRITGSASTSFAFTDFQLTKPRVASVLSVADTIHLEYDFTLVPKR
jgi:polyisoprenoid-binding protein YceI